MSQSEVRLIRRENRVKLTVVVAILTLSLSVLIFVSNMLVSFILAFVISYMLNPFVAYFERRGNNRTLVILFIFLVSGLFFGLAVMTFAPDISSQLEQLEKASPKYIDGFNELIHNTEKSIQSRLGTVIEIPTSGGALRFFKDSASNLLSSIPGLAGQLLTITLLAPIFAFFMLRDGRMLARKLLALVPNNVFELSLNLLHQINEQMGGFIRARLLESAIVGGIIWGGLAWIDFPYAFFFALLAGVTNLIPYIGPFIGAIPAFLVAFINKEPTSVIAALGIVYLVAQLIDTVFIIPLVVAKIVDLHPVTVIVVMIIGSQVMGILGMLISIPVASILKLGSSAIYNHLISFRS